MECSFLLFFRIFSNLRTRKEKTTVFIVKQLGEITSLRLYKSNFRELIYAPLINHRKIRVFLKFFNAGLHLVDKPYFALLQPKRKVIRNGVRLRKAVRK